MGRERSGATTVLTDSRGRKWSSGTDGRRSTSLSKSTYHKKSVPMTFVEFLQREATMEDKKKKKNRNQKRNRRSSLRSDDGNDTKSVRFATNPENDAVWFLMKDFEPVPKNQHKKLWTTDDEKYDRYEQDMDLVDRIEEDYLDALFPAYATSQRNSSHVDMDFALMHECSHARGLEAEVLQDLLSSHVRKHNRAVLKAQAILLQDEDTTHNDEEEEDATFRIGSNNDSRWKPIRAQSLKYSKRSQLIANKMAQFDRDCVLKQYRENYA